MTHNDEPLIEPKIDLPKNKNDHFFQPDTLTQVLDDQHQLVIETGAVDKGEPAIIKPTVYPGLGASIIPENQENPTDKTAPKDEPQQPERVVEAQADDNKMENPPDDDEGTLYQGEVEIQELIKKGNDLFLVVGVAGVGKTQLLDAFDEHQNGTLSVFKKSGNGRVKATAFNTLSYLSIKSSHLRGNNAIFIDAAGENFSGLYPGDGKSLTQKDLKLPELVLPRLRGLILVIELEAYWTDDQYSKKNQIRIVTWILMLFRWLLNDGFYDPKSELSLEEYINHFVNNMKGLKTRLNIPVQVLFSKADKLYDLTIPGSQHPLFPREDSPFFLAYHYLPGLHQALLEHTHYFRYDFVHSIVTDTDTQEVEAAAKKGEEDKPCGVELSFQWLLNHPGKGSPRTEDLIEKQKKIDKLLFWRRSRWKKKSIVKA